jgi:hypothetical protein
VHPETAWYLLAAHYKLSSESGLALRCLLLQVAETDVAGGFTLMNAEYLSNVQVRCKNSCDTLGDVVAEECRL